MAQSNQGLQWVFSADVTDLSTGLKKVSKEFEKTAKVAEKSSKDISKSTKGMDAATSALGKLGKAALAFAGARELVKFAKAAIEAGAQMEKLERVSTMVFGSMSEDVTNWAAKSTAAYGLTEKEALGFANSYGRMLKGLGKSERDASGMSVELTKLAGNLAHINDMAQGDAFQAIQAGMAGAIQPLKRLGYNLSTAAMQQHIYNMGLDVQYNHLDQNSQMMLRYNYLLHLTKDVQDANVVSAGTWSGQMMTLRRNWELFSVSVGRILTTILMPLIRALNVIVSVLAQATAALSNFLRTLFGVEAPAIKANEALGGMTEGMGDDANDAAKGLKKVRMEVNKLMGIDELNIIPSDKDPNADKIQPGSISMDFGGIDFGELDKASRELSAFEKKWAEIMDRLRANKHFQSVMDSLGRIARTGFDMVKSISLNLWDNVVESWDEMLPHLQRGFQAKIQLFDNMLSDIADAFEKWAPVWTVGINNVVDAIFDTFRPLTTFMAQLWADVWEIALDVWNTYGAPFLEEIGRFVDGVITTFLLIWTEIIDPIISPAIAFVKEMWDDHVKDIVQKAVELVAHMVVEALRFYNDFIRPIIHWVIEILGPAFAGGFEKMLDAARILFTTFFEAIDKILDALLVIFDGVITMLSGIFGGDWQMIWDGAVMILEGALDLMTAVIKAPLRLLEKMFEGTFDGVFKNIQDVFDNVIGIFKGLINFVAGVFTGDWGRVWEGIVQIFSNIVSGIGNIFKIPINAMIGMLNVFIGGLNKIQIPDWVPLVGGKGINMPAIPRLADGGILYKETTATMAEYSGARTNPEIVAPLDRLQALIDTGSDIDPQDLQEMLRLLRRIADKDMSVSLDSKEINRASRKSNAIRNRKLGVV